MSSKTGLPESLGKLTLADSKHEKNTCLFQCDPNKRHKHHVCLYKNARVTAVRQSELTRNGSKGLMEGKGVEFDLSDGTTFGIGPETRHCGGFAWLDALNNQELIVARLDKCAKDGKLTIPRLCRAKRLGVLCGVVFSNGVAVAGVTKDGDDGRLLLVKDD